MATATLFGLGCDVVRMSRIRRIYTKFGDRFLQRAFHPDEINIFHGMNTTKANTNTKITPTPKQIEFLASRWAIKEAATKAFAQHRVAFPEMCVTKTTTSSTSIYNSLVPFRPTAVRPTLEFSPTVNVLCQQLSITHTHVSLSHDEEYAYAAVVLERD